MTSIKKQGIKISIVLSLILGMGATSFAGNTISDVPASANEIREIKRETTPYNGSCDIEQNLAFYDKSPVYLRVGQPKSTVNYVFDKKETYVIIYNKPLFAGSIKFPYISNFVPSSSFESDSSNIVTVEAKEGIFSGGAMTMDRDEIAGQIITKNMERAALQNNAGANLGYYYRLANSSLTLKNGNIKINIHPQLTPKTSCTNYYVARCGDGVIDKATGSSDGNGGIQIPGGTFLAWHANSIKPNEICDDGAQNGQAGKCKTDCTGIGGGNPQPTGGATCTLTASASSIQPGQSVTINASYTSGATATLTPSLSGLAPFTYPTRNGSATDTPTTTTIYTLTVGGANGLSGTTCTTTVSVSQPPPTLQCVLTINPSVVATGTIVSVGWKVNNGPFVGAYINVSPAMNGWPHAVNANQSMGVTQAVPLYTGDYLFSYLIFNNDNTQTTTCTGVLHVVDGLAPCSLTTSTPTINPGQTAILNGSYSNGVLATMTPNITGLNFLYPTRSNDHIAVSPTSTTTYTLNVLGIAGGSGSMCSTTIHVINTGLTINKQLVTNILYHSGDNVTFKIDFANNSASTINNIVVSDFLPASLEYVNSQLFGVAPFTWATGTVGPNTFVEYSGFSLTPGQQGYLLVTGKFKGYAYANQTLNNAFVKGEDTPVRYSSALFTAYTPSGNASIVKTSDKSSYYPGQDARFTITVTNNGPDAISNIQITDNWPTSSCITPDAQWTSTLPLTMSSTSNPYTWTYPGSLAAGQTISLFITGHISDSATCIGNYINNAAIRYDINTTTQTGVAPGVNFEVSTTPSSTVTFEKRLISYGSKSGDPVVFELLYQNNGTATITNIDVVDYWPGTLNFVSSSPMPTTQIPEIGGSTFHWIITTPLAPNAIGKITINGTIK